MVSSWDSFCMACSGSALPSTPKQNLSHSRAPLIAVTVLPPPPALLLGGTASHSPWLCRISASAVVPVAAAWARASSRTSVISGSGSRGTRKLKARLSSWPRVVPVASSGLGQSFVHSPPGCPERSNSCRPSSVSVNCLQPGPVWPCCNVCSTRRRPRTCRHLLDLLARRQQLVAMPFQRSSSGRAARIRLALT